MLKCFKGVLPTASMPLPMGVMRDGSWLEERGKLYEEGDSYPISPRGFLPFRGGVLGGVLNGDGLPKSCIYYYQGAL